MGGTVSWPAIEGKARAIAPGLSLAALLTLIALAIGEAQERFLDYAVLEPLVLALLLGLAVRALWPPGDVFVPGIGFSAKQLLEFAIVLLGASLNLAAIIDAGFQLLLAVGISVSVTLVSGVALGRLVGLSTRLSILIAVGNAICGNSAIAAVAPVIRAKKQEIASAIALTAVLGIGVVLMLPTLISLFDLTDERYGVIAGLTVYAVPQVLAATIPVSAEAGQVASLVKLTRVLLLGPVVALFAWLYRKGDEQEATARLSLGKFLPWFVTGFAALALLRTGSVIPAGLGDLAKDASKILTSIAMAGLGLSVDLRSVRSSGSRVALTVIGLTILLVSMALTIVVVMDIG